MEKKKQKIKIHEKNVQKGTNAKKSVSGVLFIWRKFVQVGQYTLVCSNR